MTSEFACNHNSGFKMTFANGWTVSVQFAGGNYCTNRNDKRDQRSVVSYSCKDAEIAAWDQNDNWYDFENDQVEGWQTADQVAAFIQKVAAF